VSPGGLFVGLLVCGQEQVVEPGARRRGQGHLGGKGVDEAFGEDAEFGVICCEREVRMPKARSEETP
jgi:hypothetical protein